ncbi:MAG: FAD:protein FMN transferase [Planctomycetota bacterium]|nr:FAD:protein FMN transferase [Planctomycetota bacterium]
MLLLSALLLLLCGCRSPLHRIHVEHASMGTRFQITAYHADREYAQGMIGAALTRIDQIDQVCSDWQESSELRQLCRSAPHPTPVAVSPDLLQVMKKSLEISRASEGAFDPTVGGLMRLWRRCHRAGRLPRDHEVEKARRGMGIDGIIIDEEASTVQLLREGVAIDLGGIAKGHAVQEVFSQLEKGGIRHLIIDGGGDLVLGDPPPGRRGWRIAIGFSKLETSADLAPLKLLISGRVAVATSGDASQFTEIEGRRYSHILDPTTGIGIAGPHQVTVVSTDGATADALATAIAVLEITAVTDLLFKFPGSSALLVDPRDGSHQVLGTLPLTIER